MTTITLAADSERLEARRLAQDPTLPMGERVYHVAIAYREEGTRRAVLTAGTFNNLLADEKGRPTSGAKRQNAIREAIAERWISSCSGGPVLVLHPEDPVAEDAYRAAFVRYMAPLRQDFVGSVANPRLPLDARIYSAALAWTNEHGFATFRRSELPRLLLEANGDRHSQREVQDAIAVLVLEKGLLKAGSGLECLVLPADTLASIREAIANN